MCAKIKNLQSSTSHRHKPKGVTSRDFHKVHWPYIPAWLLATGAAIAAGAAEFGAAGAVAGGLSMTLATLAILL
jgi:hypothetical protein